MAGSPWPEGAGCAAAVTIDFDAEEVWLSGGAAHRADVSQGGFGARVAVPLLLELLGRLEIAATFFVPGTVAERHPEVVEAILAAGHEVGHHGHRHLAPQRLSEAEEREELARGLDALRARGAEVEGYRAPGWGLSERTLTLAGEHGLRYSSNLMDDIRPCRHPGSGLIELPVHWSLDDAPHFWFGAADWSRRMSEPDAVRRIWQAELEGIRRLGGLLVLTLHPQLIGRPGRIGMLEAFLEQIRAAGDVWVAPGREIARWWEAAEASGRPAD